MSTASEKVKQIRVALGLTQEEYAKRLGVSRNYVSMIEGGRDPSQSLLVLAAAIETITMQFRRDVDVACDRWAITRQELANKINVEHSELDDFYSGRTAVPLDIDASVSLVAEDALLNLDTGDSEVSQMPDELDNDFDYLSPTELADLLISKGKTLRDQLDQGDDDGSGNTFLVIQKLVSAMKKKLH